MKDMNPMAGKKDENNVLPSQCPVCKSKVEFDGIHLMCTNDRCEGKIAKQLTTALSVLDIKGVGEKTIEPFAEDFDNMYEIIVWIYYYGNDPVISNYGITLGSKSHENFISAFKNIKSLSYEQVIQMLGYENVGKKISIQLSREHAGMDYDYANLEKALVAKLRSPEVSNYIKEVVEGLEDLGIKIDRPKAESSETIGICMTGSPKEFGYATKAEFLAKFPGAKEVSLTDSSCRYLITDSYQSTSSKMKTAVKRGINILTYGDFKL
jgi:NAD-dependent DNA ligase